MHRLERAFAGPLGGQREIHHHDAVLLHDADQQHDADDADNIQRHMRQCRISSAPSPAEGKVERMVIGTMKLS